MSIANEELSISIMNHNLSHARIIPKYIGKPIMFKKQAVKDTTCSKPLMHYCKIFLRLHKLQYCQVRTRVPIWNFNFQTLKFMFDCCFLTLLYFQFKGKYFWEIYNI